MADDSALADALTTELIDRGFTVVERRRLLSILDEHKLSMAGLLEKDNGKKLGKILNVNALVFVNGAYNNEVAYTATTKVVDITTGEVLVSVNYSNGWGGSAGSPADKVMKQSLSGTARSIANAVATKFNLSATPH